MQSSYDKFNEHISKWNTFLKESKLALSNMREDTFAQEICKQRQIQVMSNVGIGAVCNPILMRDFIDPENIQPTKLRKIDDAKFIQTTLDQPQKDAVSKAVNTESLCFIQGPPGTGKTTVITEICLQLLRANPTLRILVCSETHVAVDNLIEKFYAMGKKKIVRGLKAIRIFSKNTSDNEALKQSSLDAYTTRYINSLYRSCVGDEIVQEIASALDTEEKPEMTNAINREFILNADIVGVTCNSLDKLKLDPEDAFDYIIFDEVCKATLPEILSPIEIAKRAILVGDPKQLPPVFLQEDIDVMEENGLDELAKYMYIDNLFNRLPASHKQFLANQYRMTNEIGDIISDCFYDGELHNGLNRHIRDSIVWCDYVPTKEWGKLKGVSPSNMDEVRIIREILSRENAKATKKQSVAVITPYIAQKKLVLDNIDISSYSKLDVDVDTVDSFQGKDADIVIFSVTRSCGSLIFFSNPRRLNVAISRAKNMCYIVGYSAFIKRNDVLRDIYSKIKKIKF